MSDETAEERIAKIANTNGWLHAGPETRAMIEYCEELRQRVAKLEKAARALENSHAWSVLCGREP